MAEAMETNESDGKRVNGKNKTRKKQKSAKKQVYIPGGTSLEEDEELVVDESAYIMLHQATTGDPCLSFEVLRDGLGENREMFPMTSYLLGGTQSETGHCNYILLVKMSDMHKTLKEEKNCKSKDDDNDSSEEDSEDESDEEDHSSKLPKLQQTMIPHNGCVNRIKSSWINDHLITASWSEQGIVFINDATKHLSALEDPKSLEQFSSASNHGSPLFSFNGHGVEGFSLAWSKHDQGRLLSGDCNKSIYMWTPTETSWQVGNQSFLGHSASVEDIQWSPKESNVFMTCSVDKSLRIWDARIDPAKACKLVAFEAHSRDVNVIDWSSFEPLVISGGDDGLIKIWDLRKFTTGKEVAVFEHHRAPITSVEWNPMESSVFIASGSDDQVSIWDLAVEHDDVTGKTEEEPDVPPQLLFMHLGQKDVKEVHWHPQVPGLIFSTAQSGFNIFRTISV